MKPATKPWYKKKRYLIPGGLFGLIFALGAMGGGSSPQAASAVNTAAVVHSLRNTRPVAGEVAQPSDSSGAPTQAPIASPAAKPTRLVAPQPNPSLKPVYSPTPAPTPALSNDNYYTNVDGNSVHAPAYSDSAPAGASAKCGDGTYSFSQHRSGTCSHHGGVARWY